MGEWGRGVENGELVKMKGREGDNNRIMNGMGGMGWMRGGKCGVWVDEDIGDMIRGKGKDFMVGDKKEGLLVYMGREDVEVGGVRDGGFGGKRGLGGGGEVILEVEWRVGEMMERVDSVDIGDNRMLVLWREKGGVIDDGYEEEGFELVKGERGMKD